VWEPSHTLSEGASRASIFADLSAKEIKSIVTFLTETSKELGIVVASSETPINQNYIQYMERFAPIKAEALSYLDEQSNKKPARFARVIVARGGDSTPTLVEYKVGPLPISAESQATVYATKPFSKRLVDKIEYNWIDAVVVDFGKKIADITTELAGAKYTDDCERCLTYADTAPRAWKAGDRQTWFWFMYDTPGYYLFPIGIEFLVDHKSTNTADWKIAGVLYGDVLYASTEEFIAAYKAPGFQKLPPRDYNEDAVKPAAFERRGPVRHLEHLPPPSQVEPGGNRLVLRPPGLKAAISHMCSHAHSLTLAHTHTHTHTRTHTHTHTSHLCRLPCFPHAIVVRGRAAWWAGG
jgi:hypothetical protein